MLRENVRIVKRLRGAAVAAAAVALLSAPVEAALATPFREVVVARGASSVQSDGVRFAWPQRSPGDLDSTAVRVFDTLRGRNFRLAAPRPGCIFGAIGGGLALWSCISPETMLLTNLSTGRSREPAGIEQLEQMAQPEYMSCRPWGVGRYWLQFSCGNGFGPGDEPYQLNHRTGRLTYYLDPFSPDLPFIDLDYPGLLRPYCAPLEAPSDWSHAPPYFDYAPPFALHAPAGTDPRIDAIRLSRCGGERAKTLSRCRLTDCRTPQLGSDYVTWGEHKRVYAYLPSIDRRVLVGKAPADFSRGLKLSVAHTCNRIFARWGMRIYAARFEPRRGAPRCQSAR